MDASRCRNQTALGQWSAGRRTDAQAQRHRDMGDDAQDRLGAMITACEVKTGKYN